MGLITFFAQARSFVVPKNLTGSATLQGVVSATGTIVYTQPDAKSPPLGKLKNGDMVSTGPLINGWYPVKLLLQGNAVKEGWIAANDLTLVASAPAPVTTALIQPKSAPAPSKNLVNASSSDSTLTHAERISLGWAPVLNIYRYGASQQGVLAEFQHQFRRFYIGVPVGYSFGNNFTDIATGISFGVDLFKIGNLTGFVQPEVLAEYLFGGGKKMWAASSVIKWGARYDFSASFGLGIEPYSVIGMFWNNQEIPWNLRSRSVLYAFFTF